MVASRGHGVADPIRWEQGPSGRGQAGTAGPRPGAQPPEGPEYVTILLHHKPQQEDNTWQEQ